MTATSADEFNAAASDFQVRFLDALGLEPLWALDPRRIVGMTHNGAGSAEEIAKSIGAKGADTFYDALKVAGNDDLDQLINLIQEDPELAQSIHRAVATDPTMIVGLQKIFAGGEEDFNTEDLKRIINNPEQRGFLIDVMNKVTEGVDSKGLDINFAHVQTLLDQSKKNDQAGMFSTIQSMGIGPEFGFGDFMAFLKELMENPTLAINNLVNTLVTIGKIDPADADMAKGIMVPAGKLIQATVEPYYDVAEKYNLGPETPGRVMASLEESGRAITEEYGGVELPVAIQTSAATTNPTAQPVDADPAVPATQDVASLESSITSQFGNVPFDTRQSSGHEITVAEEETGVLKGRGGFDLASLGISPKVTAEQEAKVNAYDANTPTVIRSATPVSAMG